jgi:multidrug efflux pump subunit AcrB
MGGGAGEWFRPFALTVAASVMVSLFISFTLDPMLSAYWGDPPGYAHREKKGIDKWLGRFNDWFDHQANRYGDVIAWALHHRMYGLAPCSCWSRRWGTRENSAGEFLPKSDYGTLAMKCTPSSTSLERSKVEKAAELARQIPEVKSTDSRVNATGGRVWVDIGDKTDRAWTAGAAGDLRDKLKVLVGGIRGTGRSQQWRAQAGADPVLRNGLAQAHGDHESVHGQDAPIPRQDVGSEQDPKDELRIELDRGVANQLAFP